MRAHPHRAGTKISMKAAFTQPGPGIGDRSAPGHQSLEPLDAGEVVVDDRHHQRHQDDEADEQHLLLHLHAEVPACDALERHDEDVPAVEHGNGQQVDEAEIEADLPDVAADSNQIKQVLVNLLENAAAYSDEGTRITVSARITDGEVEVRVADQGVGIAPEELEKVFNKFYRGAQRRRRPGGTGLGLAICESIVLAHGGRIWAESKLGRGSTFYFTLPVSQAGETRTEV